MLSESDVVVQKLAEAFEELGIDYMVGGSVASSIHGIPRFTQDVDMIARFGEEPKIEALARRLEDEFYVDVDLIRDAIANHSSFNVIYLLTMTKADVFVPEETAWKQSEWKRRRREPVGSEGEASPVFVASAEDMVLQKLLWYRMTGERSDRQWGDVQGILKVQGEALDFSYLRHWVVELEIADLLVQAFEDAGVPDEAGKNPPDDVA
jgi:hypothetical protein